MSITICGPKCSTEQKNSQRGCGDPQVSYVGAVLDIYEANFASDSDFYAVVWDAATSSVKTVWYATTSAWTYHNGARCDASPEVHELARESKRDAAFKHVMAAAIDVTEAIEVGVDVRSTTTRGKNVGVEGRVVRKVVDSYRHSSFVTYYRVQVQFGTERRWLSSDRVERINKPEIDVAEVRERADRWLAGANFRSLARIA